MGVQITAGKKFDFSRTTEPGKISLIQYYLSMSQV